MGNIKFLYFLFFVFFIFSCSKDNEPNKEQVGDTTAPTLSFSIADAETTSNEPITVSETIEVNIEATDASGISKIEAFIDNEKVGEDITAPFSISIDISGYSSTSGKSYSDLNSILKIVATDKEGNEATLEQDIIIITRAVLLTINVPEGFINSFFQNVSVFASDMDGNYLEGTSKPINLLTRKIKIFAPEDFDLTKEFMITFMTYNPPSSDGRSWSYATTFQNLTKENLKEINFKVPERVRVIEDKFLPAVGFGTSIFPNGDGFDYRTSLYPDEEEWLCETLQPLTETDRVSDKIYLSYILNQDFSDYYYLLLDRPLPDDFQLDANAFVNDDSATKNIDFLNIQQQSELRSNVKIYGYENETAVQKDIFHTVWNQGSQNFQLPVAYSYNNSFHQFRHIIQMQNFHTAGLGLPQDEYTIPGWTIDPVLQNNTVALNKTGEGHSVGRVSLRDDQIDDIYEWRIIFDSNNTSEVVIPKLPPQFQNRPLSVFYDADAFSIQQSEISRYQGINSYQNYLSEIIKEDRDANLFSDKKETIFKSYVNVYFEFSDSIFD